MSEAPAAVNEATSHASLTWWLAAGLVGADIGTSVFYSTGVLYPHVGYTAPFFVLAVALCMWLFKLTYQEGCSVSPINGGAYSMVLQTIGRRAALIVGSMTILSYLATAVVSALSGALYLASLWSQTWPVWQVAALAAAPVVLFMLLNLVGLKESTRLVFAVAAFHFSTLILMDCWGLWVAIVHGAHWDRLLTGFHALPPSAMLLGFASAFLGISGFESAAQIIEEIERPASASIRKVYLAIVALVSFTAPVSSLLCMVLLSDTQIQQYQGAFLSGLAMELGGRPLMVLLVFNACFTLFAAVNTAFAGATGLMTTMGKQGNLPDVVLTQWSHIRSWLGGFPFVAIPFAVLCGVMLAAFPGEVDQLGDIYGMAFLGVMVSYCLGVLLLRLFQPYKVERSDYVSRWTFGWRKTRLPVAPLLGGALLLLSEVTLFVTARESRSLGIELFLIILLIMTYYRLGQVEYRMVQLPDLRLGCGQYRDMAELPSLPTYVICTAAPNPEAIVTVISHLLKQFGDNIEVVLFHAEERNAPHGQVADRLERLVSQQLEEFFEERNFILSVKVLPGTLIEVLPEYGKTRRIDRVFVMSNDGNVATEDLARHLSNELGLEVTTLLRSSLPKGPGVWYSQWVLERKHDRDLS